MRLSDVKGERTIDVIAECIGPIANIAEDPEASRLFRREKLPDGMSKKVFLLERAKASVPPLLKAHKADVIKILSVLEGVSEERYTESLTLVKLLNDSIELMTDEVFLQVFISPQIQKEEDTSGSV